MEVLSVIALWLAVVLSAYFMGIRIVDSLVAKYEENDAFNYRFSKVIARAKLDR